MDSDSVQRCGGNGVRPCTIWRIYGDVRLGGNLAGLYRTAVTVRKGRKGGDPYD